MSKSTFAFISLFYVLFAIFAWVDHVDITVQLAVSGLFIFLVGIPHGAIDHILFLDSSKTKPIYFYTAYLGLMLLYAFTWVIFPLLSFIFFILMSAYHFGQSQFSELIKIPVFIRQVLYSLWGVSILSGLLYYNLEELYSLFQSSAELAFITEYMTSRALEIVLFSSSALTLFIFGVIGSQMWLRSERLATELYLFLLIHAAFFVLPIIIGFTLYFTVLHSFKVLSQEYKFLEYRKGKITIKRFAGMLAPYTLLSIVGLGALLMLKAFDILSFSNLLIALILISAVTLPHSFVMERFYSRTS